MKQKIDLPILIEQDEDNTVEEAMKNIEEVIVMCLE
jgi:hypothetical protein